MTHLGVNVDFGDYPGFLPGTAISIVIALVLSGSVARRLGAPRVVAWLLVASLGIILSVTLTPGRGSSSLQDVTTTAGCDLHRIGPAPWAEYLDLGLSTFNVLLFVPLGAAIGALPQRRLKARLLLCAFVLPFGIEAVQLAATPLGRACQSADVSDNLIGLALGVGLGLAYGLLSRRT